MKVLIMSDIHGNKEALEAVLSKAAGHAGVGGCILLGDLIDYGMHSNEVIQMIKNIPYPVLCNISGNHENAVMRDTYSRFSSGRGRESARYTRSVLDGASWDYMHREMLSSGSKEFEMDGKKCLAVHGSLEDEYWGSIRLEGRLPEYRAYDYVFSGHSHLPHMAEKYYECQDAERRNKKKVIFINPGSVGQPRNLNPMAQFALLDTEKESVLFAKAEYNIAAEQAAYHGQVDRFYRDRLEWGI